METAFLRGLKQTIEELVNEAVAKWVRKPPGSNPWWRIGEVTAVVGNVVKVLWDGETAATGATYPCLSTYSSPTVGDRVYATPIGKTWLVHGKVVTS